MHLKLLNKCPDKLRFYRGMMIGYGQNVIIARDGGKIIGWMLFSDDRNFGKKVLVDDTGIYVKYRYRKHNIATKLQNKLLRHLNFKYGKGNFVFKSYIISRGGAKLWNKRVAATINQKEHVANVPPHPTSKYRRNIKGLISKLVIENNFRN